MQSKSTTHNPSNFNPDDYRVVGYFDNKPPVCPPLTGYGDQARIEIHHAATAKWREEVKRCVPSGKIHRCAHCGNGTIRYVAAVEHIPTGERVAFGDVCVDRLNFSGRDSFRAKHIRTHAANMAAMQARLEAVAEYIAKNPELGPVLAYAESPECQNFFVRDIVGKLNHYGSISDKQRDAIINAHQRDLVFLARKAEEAEAKKDLAPLVEGRRLVVGVVLSTKRVENDFGVTFKMLVKEDETGCKIWGTIPSSIDRVDSIKGAHIRFTARIERSKDDHTFGFASRPTKGEFIEQEAGA